jgi:hypothetical protein
MDRKATSLQDCLKVFLHGACIQVYKLLLVVLRLTTKYVDLVQLLCFDVFMQARLLVIINSKLLLHMTYYIYKRNRAGASFQLGWSFNKKDLAAKLEKYAFWKQNGYAVFYIERS